MPSDDYKESLYNSIDNLVELPNGQKEFGDLSEFHRVVDFFADRYGLGGFESLEKFADMIDNTDPVLLNGLYGAGVKAENRKWGGDKDEDDVTNTDDIDSDIPQTYTKGDSTPKERSVIPTTPRAGTKTATGGGSIRNMLIEFGVKKDEVDDAGNKIGRRKIVLKDYRDVVDKDNLKTMTEEQFHAILKDMSNERKKSINFDVSDEMYREKLKKQSGK